MIYMTCCATQCNRKARYLYMEYGESPDGELNAWSSIYYCPECLESLPELPDQYDWVKIRIRELGEEGMIIT